MVECGLQYSAMIYNVFCASVLYFLAQLLVPPVHVLEKEGNTMRTIAKGPTLWAVESDLWQMRPRCGIGRSFHCISARSEAAKLRAFYFETWERSIAEEVTKLRKWSRESYQDDRQVWWRPWYDKAYPLILTQNKSKVERRQITNNSVKAAIEKGKDPAKDALKVRSCFQTVAAS